MPGTSHPGSVHRAARLFPSRPLPRKRLALLALLCLLGGGAAGDPLAISMPFESVLWESADDPNTGLAVVGDIDLDGDLDSAWRWVRECISTCSTVPAVPRFESS